MLSYRDGMGNAFDDYARYRSMMQAARDWEGGKPVQELKVDGLAFEEHGLEDYVDWGKDASVRMVLRNAELNRRLIVRWSPLVSASATQGDGTVEVS